MTIEIHVPTETAKKILLDMGWAFTASQRKDGAWFVAQVLKGDKYADEGLGFSVHFSCSRMHTEAISLVYREAYNAGPMCRGCGRIYTRGCPHCP